LAIFSFNETKEGALCITSMKGAWIVYTEERDLRVFEKSFDDFSSMREFILLVFSKDYYGGNKIKI
jgi:hypothetical protein